MKNIRIDFETNGIDPTHDQPLAVTAEVYENETCIDKLDIKCRPTVSRLGSPVAYFVNNINPLSLKYEMSLYEFMLSLHEFIEKHSPAYITAWNAKFDFNFSFNGYYQNVTTSNWYQWKNPNRLIDGLEVFKSLFVFKNELKLINIPLNTIDEPSFELERVAKENHVNSVFHSSAGDVEAMSKLMNLAGLESGEIIKKAKKSSVKKNVINLMENESFFCVALGGGKNLAGRALVPIAFDKNKTNAICFDIGLADPKGIGFESSWEIFRRISDFDKDNWLVKVPLNKQKVFFEQSFYPFCINARNHSYEELLKRASVLKDKKHFIEACNDAFSFVDSLYPLFPEEKLEKEIFTNFASPAETLYINSFNDLPFDERWSFTEESNILNKSNRIRRLSKKVLFEHDESLVPSSKYKMFREFCNKRLFNLNEFKTPWTNINKVLYELDYLRENYPASSNKIKRIEDYYDKRLSEGF